MDWLRLQKALSVEAERGFNDLLGNQYRFSEFLSLSLSRPPTELPAPEQQRFQAMGEQFANYAEMTFAQRQHLVAEARRTLYQVQRSLDEQVEKTVSESGGQSTGERSPATSPLKSAKLPRTAVLVEAKPNRKLELDQAITYLPGVGAKNSERLAKLGLITVRDLLYYYPRDHIDYARQVNIRDLVEGQTVTLVATVKRCTCFSSPRNPKLTIFEVLVRDHTGQIKLSSKSDCTRLGRRWRHRDWLKKASLA
jgi:ATP-dependent DNA helicase RecG